MRLLTRILTAAGFAAGFTLVGAAMATPASASCAGSPVVSAHPFTGTVTAVTNRGRTATVRTDDGRTVTVLGSEATGSAVATSVDRTYQVGLRYEFHPFNDADPYHDNGCSATHAIGAASGATAAGSSSSGPWVGVLSAGAAVLVVAGVIVWYLRRRNLSAATPARRGTAA
jgi:hypothetical protein